MSLLLLAFCGVSAGDALTLARDGVSDYVIVLSSGATVVDRTAARELQEHLALVFGATLPVAEEAEAPADRPQIVLGAGERQRALFPEADLDSLGPDGIEIRSNGPHLLLAGRPPRGTLYAVYTFLEDAVGCRWWTSTESTIPRRPTLEVPPQTTHYTPALRCREAFYKDAFEGIFAARSKCNGHFENIPPEYGGHYRILGWCHTFYQLLPPERYFAEHPDWYSEINGQRVHEHAQLCLTNTEMRAELVKQALAWIAKEPTAGMISIAQNDWGGRCQCDACRAVEEEEGSPAGPLVRFVNAVAAEIGRQYPDFLVETLAYHYTRQPPKLTRAADNVVIRLCTIECSFVQPLATGPQNEAFQRDIEGWAAMAPNLYVWDYVTNFANHLIPHPNLRVLAPNIRYFVQNHAIGLFEQGDAYSTVGDFVRLRAWLLAHLMWDPSRDPEALIDEFLAGYYGAAAPALRRYLDLLLDAAEQSGVYLRCFMTDTAAWLPLEVAAEATKLFDQALAAVADDPVLTARVRRERLPLDLVWLDRYAAFKRQARRAGIEFVGPADPAAAYDEWLALCTQHNNQFYGEGRPFGPYAEALKLRFRPAGPPPEPCRDLPEDDWLDAQDNLLTLHGLGNWVTVVDDAGASDGKAARMPASHTQWAVQWPLSEDLADGSKWRCYIALRVDAKAAAGNAAQVGLYDGKNRTGVFTQTLKIEDTAGPEYRLIDCGAYELHGGMYLWVAPVNNPTEVDAVYVDRMFVVRDR